MTEPAPDIQPGAVTKVAADLRAIETLAAALAEEAANESTSKLMPGGKAMVLLAHHASLEAWESMQETTERTGTHYTSAEDEDPEDHWDAMQLLLFWSESTRREFGEEYGQRPTLVSEASYLRWRLEHLWQTEAGWDDLARDIRKARARLEDIVHAGSRAERSRVVCDCDDAPRLIRVWADAADEDGWKCPACKRRFTAEDHKRMFARQLRSEGAEKYVPLPDAVAVLRDEGRPERTVRKWTAGEDHREDDPIGDLGFGYCEVKTRRTFTWWPRLWHRHLTTKTRKRDAA